jgi:hypothetical protein
MSSPTLVIADYPIGYASGFGETLSNLFSGFPSNKLWSAHLEHLSPIEEKKRAQPIHLPSPSRPRWLPPRISLAYYPFLKVHQFLASRETVRHLANALEMNSIKNLLVVPVTPWLLSAALTIHKLYPQLNLVVYVMDDWQGHHESHRLPYSHRRQHLLREIISRAGVRFAVSREMAAHYEEVYGGSWLVAHNGIQTNVLPSAIDERPQREQILLAGDVNVFRFDAVRAFAEAIERHNQRYGRSVSFTIMGEIAEQHRAPLAALRAVKLLSRRAHSECLKAMKTADLLYLPLAFCKQSSRISLYSMPTKLPEYLGSGKNVFFHAPKDSALFRVAERYDLNPRLATIEPQALDAFLEEWIEADQKPPDGIAKMKRALLEEFDIDQLSRRFQAAFD